MGASKALAECAVEAAAQRWPADALRDRALRQRARLVGLGRADLPPPDRARRAGDGDRPAHDALLHDDPGGRAADHPRRLARARGGDVFVLEMGEPVSIIQLARDMIELSGLEPDRDIAIEIVGRRPGEKLHEELFNPYERPAADAGREDPAGRARAARPRRVAAMFDEIALLVLEGDAAALAAKVGALSRRAATACASPAPRSDRPDGPLAWPLHDGRSSPPSRSRAETRSTARYAGLAAVLGLGVLVAALLRPGARGQAAARVGGPRARARGRDGGARRRRRPGEAARRRRPPLWLPPLRAPAAASAAPTAARPGAAVAPTTAAATAAASGPGPARRRPRRPLPRRRTGPGATPRSRRPPRAPRPRRRRGRRAAARRLAAAARRTAPAQGAPERRRRRSAAPAQGAPGASPAGAAARGAGAGAARAPLRRRGERCCGRAGAGAPGASPARAAGAGARASRQRGSPRRRGRIALAPAPGGSTPGSEAVPAATAAAAAARATQGGSARARPPVPPRRCARRRRRRTRAAPYAAGARMAATAGDGRSGTGRRTILGIVGVVVLVAVVAVVLVTQLFDSSGDDSRPASNVVGAGPASPTGTGKARRRRASLAAPSPSRCSTARRSRTSHGRRPTG